LTVGQNHFFSYSSAVLQPDEASLLAIAEQIGLVDASLKAARAMIEKLPSPTIFAECADHNSTWALVTTYTPTSCRHIPKLPKAAEGCLTDLPDVYVDVKGRPRCILCAQELDWCPRCCKAPLIRQTYPRTYAWRGHSAETVAYAADFNLFEDRVLVVRECRACGFAEISSTRDSEAYML
jgi:hypothetical protein